LVPVDGIQGNNLLFLDCMRGNACAGSKGKGKTKVRAQLGTERLGRGRRGIKVGNSGGEGRWGAKKNKKTKSEEGWGAGTHKGGDSKETGRRQIVQFTETVTIAGKKKKTGGFERRCKKGGALGGSCLNRAYGTPGRKVTRRD